MRYLVTSGWLEQQLNKKEYRVVDCRFHLDAPYKGRDLYKEGHIPGAVYFDLEMDMSAEEENHGGRHPLPDMNDFAEKLSNCGIDKSTKVVAYDDQGGAMAARFWWMLMYLGHKDVYVLDRPFSIWKEEKRPVEQHIPTYEPKVFLPEIEPHLLVHLEEVKLVLQDKTAALIDARDKDRFKGKRDNVDGIAGHIPGARHYFWKNVLDESGKWKDSNKLKTYFKDLPKEDDIFSYCGSGVTACVNVLALKEAGHENARLYAGSWSDWITYDDLPIETDKDN
ncbi:sulfurtransferase [Alteribacillus sp. YIM 98480]|uniref:sulfurtransferase n=1 Tax=Alteribacillus sp. YIM 98480 TaxID=2606599 RepID=UPI00131AC35C|nr:sulfurtransferase [Alteribacillus sp. YIM 98480]